MAHTCAVVRERTAATVIPVHTKGDLWPSDHEADGDSVRVSAESGEGLAELLQRIESAAHATAPRSPQDDVIITRERHRVGLTAARDEIAAFASAWDTGALPAPVAAVHLLAAREAIAELIGSVDTEDVLDRVFRDFCIGK
jgi:tRNA modification GTPase